MAAYSAEDFRTLQKFVANYYAAIGKDIQAELDYVGSLYGADAPNDNVRMEEVVAKTVEALASDKEALETALGVKENQNLREKVADILRRLADRVLEFFKGSKEKGLTAHNRQAQVFLDDVKALREMAEIVGKGFDNARVNEKEFGSKESGVRFSKKKPHYTKVGGNFSEALQADEWAKFTDAMTNMDAGLRISDNSMLVPCDSGIFKYVIYDKISDNRVTAVYRFGGIKYNNVVDINIAANKIASFIYEQESKGYAEPKILRRLLRDHCNNFGYILDRYNPNSKQFATIGNGITQNKAFAQGKPSGTGVSGQTQSGVSSSIKLSNKKGKHSKDDTIYSYNFKEWFGDWENNPQSASKVVDKDGEPLVLYHQTAADFTVFDTESKGAGRYDDETPNGIFLKPTDSDIGLKEKKQMALYANIRNPLKVKDREELKRFYERNIDGYEEKKAALKSIDTEYNGAPFVAKISVEEYDVDGKRRAYNAQRIKMSALPRAHFSVLNKQQKTGNIRLQADEITIADLHALVKQNDPDFNPPEI